MKYKGLFIFKEKREETIHSKKDPGKTYKKLTLVCDKKGQLDQYEVKTITFTSFGSEAIGIDSLDLRPGTEINVTFAIKTREWNQKFFTELEIKEIGILGAYRGANTTEDTNGSTPEQMPTETVQGHYTGSEENNFPISDPDPFVVDNKEEEDDLPF